MFQPSNAAEKNKVGNAQLVAGLSVSPVGLSTLS